MTNAEKNLACLVLKYPIHVYGEDIREYSLIRKPRINYFCGYEIDIKDTWTRNALALEQTRVAFAAAEPVITLTSIIMFGFKS